jgi:hypothetical protein
VGKSGKVKCGTGKSGARRKIRQQGKVENRNKGKWENKEIRNVVHEGKVDLWKHSLFPHFSLFPFFYFSCSTFPHFHFPYCLTFPHAPHFLFPHFPLFSHFPCFYFSTFPCCLIFPSCTTFPCSIFHFATFPHFVVLLFLCSTFHCYKSNFILVYI